RATTLTAVSTLMASVRIPPDSSASTSRCSTFFLAAPTARRDLHSFPTRRSSDLVAQEDPLELRRDSRGVDELVGSEAGRRTADDAADVVHPRLQAGQPGGFETRDDARNLLDRQPAELDLLARGDVGHVAATRSRDLGEQPKLAGREDPVGHADPHHEVAGGRPAEK